MTTAQMPVTLYMENAAGVPLSGEIELIAHFTWCPDVEFFGLDHLEVDDPANRQPITPATEDGASEDEKRLWEKVEHLLNHDADTQSRAHYAIQQEAA